MKQVFGIIQVEIHNLAMKHIFFLKAGDTVSGMTKNQITGDFFLAERYPTPEAMNTKFAELVRKMYGGDGTNESLPEFAMMLKLDHLDHYPSYPCGIFITLKQINVSIDGPGDLHCAEAMTRPFVFHYLSNLSSVIIPLPF